MKFLGKLILWLLVALLLVIIGAWFLLQTHWGARRASARSAMAPAGRSPSMRWSTISPPSSCAVAKRHLWSGRQACHFGGKTVDIGFSTRQFSDPLHADEIVLNDGTLNLSPHSADLPFAADRLMLRNMAFNSPETGWALSAQRVTGGVSSMDAGGGQCAGENGADPDERGLDDAQWRRSQQRSDSG